MKEVYAKRNTSQYQLLEPIPGSVNEISTSGSNSFQYFGVVYSTTLTIVVVLAVIMIVIGGLQYSASWSGSGSKEDGKKRIYGAIGGLVLALFSYLILDTINPALLEPKFPKFDGGPLTSTGAGGAKSKDTGGGGGGLVSVGGIRYGGPTSITDDEGRAELEKLGVVFDKKYGGIPDCEVVGVANTCGYFQGIKTELIDYVGDVRSRCEACLLVGRDGTGPRHSTNSGHYDGEKIDFAPSESLSKFVINNEEQFVKVKDVEKIIDGRKFLWPVYEDKQTGSRWMLEKYPDPGKDHWDVDINPTRKKI